MPPPEVRCEVVSAAPARRSFATTHWSLVVQAAACSGGTEGRAALAELCRTYWYPIYDFARRRGHSPDDAKDVTQGFFAQILADGALARADATRGRFRTFLLAVFEHYRARQHAHAGCLKRGGGCDVVSLDALASADARYEGEPATTDSPERIFDRKWALSLLEKTLAAVERDYTMAGKRAVFDSLKEVLWGGRGEVRYAMLAQRHGMTEAAIKVAMHRLRIRFREHLRLEVTKTLLHPEDVDDELRHLFSALEA
ncbi:MAG: sigma-70 family RNA polymerase sigma factor [Opitutaceae bacterium]|nr:sigma-70 family RNA polymerase sigma factor [Opitutaceae bacterium]